MSKKQQAADLRAPFYLEQRRWPLAHAALTIALYFSLRDPILAWLLCYNWESIEYLLSLKFPFMTESIGDHLVGDIIVGGLSIFTFWLLDRVTHWDVILLEQVPLWYRLTFFAVIWGMSFFVMDLDYVPKKSESGCFSYIPHFGSLLFGCLYLIIVMLFFGWFDALSENLIVWLGVVSVYALVASIRVSFPSTYLRVVGAQLIVLSMAVVFWFKYQ